MQLRGEKSRRAVRWISDSIKDSDSFRLNTIIHEAITKFDLDPRESEELILFYQRAKENQN